MPSKHGFSFLEILIVLAVIALMAAISVPSFMRAQTRSKVSRAKSGLKTLAIAIDAYFADYPYGPTDTGNGSYPIYRPYAGGHNYDADPKANLTIGYEITTPVAYLKSGDMLKDPFKEDRDDLDALGILTGRKHYLFGNIALRLHVLPYGPISYEQTLAINGQWFLTCAGPDRYSNNHRLEGPDFSQLSLPYRVSYDPTNGSLSVGDIIWSKKHGMMTPEQAPVP